jgi:hypothetical protein
MIGRMLGDIEKAPKNKILRQWSFAQKDIMGATNVNVSISENENSCSWINESENDFMDNLYDHGLPMSHNFKFLIIYLSKNWIY